jgi:hypothetical protein
LPQYESGGYPSLFVAYGDWFPLVCLVCCTIPAFVGWRERRRPPQLE